MKIITVEEHFITKEAMAILKKYNASLPDQKSLKKHEADMKAGHVDASPKGAGLQ